MFTEAESKLEDARAVVESIALKSKKAILFHSASGKDSIALLDLMYPYFEEITCVFMYVVKDLDHIARYIKWAQMRYPNCHFVQVPHYCVYSFIKYGTLGCEMNPKQRLWSLGDIDKMIRVKTGVDFVFYGFKQSDGLNRRLMLRTYDRDAINWKTGKVYPLSTYKNADILNYIEDCNLIYPEKYGKGRGQSSGTNINDIDYLTWLKENYPKDLTRIYAVYPLTESILFEYEQGVKT